LVALEVYVDDSGLGQPPVYFLGGRIGRAESRASFKDEWIEALNRPQTQRDGTVRTLEYFKMQEAFRCTGQFHGWDVGTAKEKTLELAKIAIRHSISGIHIRVRHDDYKLAIESATDVPFPGRYFFLYYCLMTATLTFLNREKIDEPVDFIFDDQLTESDRVQDAYSSFMKTAAPELTRRLGNRPIHRSDKCFLPLQAADLLAWNVRRHFHERDCGRTFISKTMEALETIHQEEGEWPLPRLEKYIRSYRESVSADERRAAERDA
jgi:Protein of unknown function (DUF3800)